MDSSSEQSVSGNRNRTEREEPGSWTVVSGGNYSLTQDSRRRSVENVLQSFRSDHLSSHRQCSAVDCGKAAVSLCVQRGHPCMILLRGYSGSGKSTLAKELCCLSAAAVVCCADDYFTDTVTGQYQMQPSKLGPAHDWCREKVKQLNRYALSAKSSVKQRQSLIIVDNTNIDMVHMRDYAQLAIANGYELYVLEPDTHWKYNTQLCANEEAQCTRVFSGPSLDEWNVAEEGSNIWDAPSVSVCNTVTDSPSTNTDKPSTAKVKKQRLRATKGLLECSAALGSSEWKSLPGVAVPSAQDTLTSTNTNQSDTPLFSLAHDLPLETKTELQSMGVQCNELDIHLHFSHHSEAHKVLSVEYENTLYVRDHDYPDTAMAQRIVRAKQNKGISTQTQCSTELYTEHERSLWLLNNLFPQQPPSEVESLLMLGSHPLALSMLLDYAPVRQNRALVAWGTRDCPVEWRPVPEYVPCTPEPVQVQHSGMFTKNTAMNEGYGAPPVQLLAGEYGYTQAILANNNMQQATHNEQQSVTFSLGTTMAQQLQQLFGTPLGVPSELLRAELRECEVPLWLAQSLFEYWLQSQTQWIQERTPQPRDNTEPEWPSLLPEDSSTEGELPLATDVFEWSSGSSCISLESSGSEDSVPVPAPDTQNDALLAQQISDEQLARHLQMKENHAASSSSIVDTEARKVLKGYWPGITDQVITQALLIHNQDIEMARTSLRGEFGPENTTVQNTDHRKKHSYAARAVFSHSQSSPRLSRAAHQARDSASAARSPGARQSSDPEQMMSRYESLREAAAVLRRKRDAEQAKAQTAIRNKNYDVAAYYGWEVRVLNNKLKHSEQSACDIILDYRRLTRPPHELDLHYLRRAEAMNALQEKLTEFDRPPDLRSKYNARVLTVITGRGTHSLNAPVLLPAVKNYLTQKQYVFKQVKEGMLRVTCK